MVVILLFAPSICISFALSYWYSSQSKKEDRWYVTLGDLLLFSLYFPAILFLWHNSDFIAQYSQAVCMAMVASDSQGSCAISDYLLAKNYTQVLSMMLSAYAFSFCVSLIGYIFGKNQVAYP